MSDRTLMIPLTETQYTRIVAAKAACAVKAGTKITWPEFCDLVSQDILSRGWVKPKEDP